MEKGGKKTESEIPTYKVVMIGDKSVGKTSIVTRYTENRFTFMSESTIGAQFFTKVLTVENPIIG
jgi:GTPase SAR1 family protein